MRRIVISGVCMDPKIDDRTSRSVASSKGKEEVVLTDDVEDLNHAVDEMCKAIQNYIFPRELVLERLPPYIIDRSRLDAQGSWSSRSQFLAFCKQYKLKFKRFMEWYSRPGMYPKKDVLPYYSCEACPIAMPDDEDVLMKYESFKRFDIVEGFSDHLFSNSPVVKTTPHWNERIRKEWSILKEKLPETIFVRVCESRRDLLRAVIIGPKGTPYHDGLFFIDVFLPNMYPYGAPCLRYHSGGFGINPHMFECGEVRLSLVRSRVCPEEIIWLPVATTILELLVAIRDRVLSADPLFHQPEFQVCGPSVVAEYFSILYNEEILIKSLKTMMHIMINPPKSFEVFVAGHFRSRAPDIAEACKAYIRGVQVGCVGNKKSCCSNEFRDAINSCFKDLVAVFKKIGATEANNFSSLSAQTPSILGSSKPELSRTGKNPIAMKPTPNPKPQTKT